MKMATTTMINMGTMRTARKAFWPRSCRKSSAYSRFSRKLARYFTSHAPGVDRHPVRAPCPTGCSLRAFGEPLSEGAIMASSKKHARQLERAWMGGVEIVAMMYLFATAYPAWGGSTKCTMKYSLTGWSAGYSTASGSGTITCDNGQSARVSLRAKGGGPTVGKSKIVNGGGTFSEVADISELFGSYGAAEAHAGMGGSALPRW